MNAICCGLSRGEYCVPLPQWGLLDASEGLRIPGIRVSSDSGESALAYTSSWHLIRLLESSQRPPMGGLLTIQWTSVALRSFVLLGVSLEGWQPCWVANIACMI